MCDYGKLSEIEKCRQECFISLEDFLKQRHPQGLNGLYWFYTSLDLNTLKKGKRRRGEKWKKDVDFFERIEVNAKKDNVIKNRFQFGGNSLLCVYIGRGGKGPAATQGGLFQRIRVEYSGGQGNGCLAIKHKPKPISDPAKWFINYVVFSDSQQYSEISCPDINYEMESLLYESLWRHKFGLPILCKLQ